MNSLYLLCYFKRKFFSIGVHNQFDWGVDDMSSTRVCMTCHLQGVWKMLSTADDVWLTSSAMDDVICKECHGKHVLPL